MTDLSTSACADDTTRTVIEPSDLDVAISVAQQLLDSDQVLSLREAVRLLLRALGAESDSTPALRDLLRLLLRALGAEPTGKTFQSDDEERVRRSVDAQFPAVAAFLAAERGEGQ